MAMNSIFIRGDFRTKEVRHKILQHFRDCRPSSDTPIVLRQREDFHPWYCEVVDVSVVEAGENVCREILESVNHVNFEG